MIWDVLCQKQGRAQRLDGDMSEGQWHQLEGAAAQMRTICASQRIKAIKDANTE